MRQSRLTAGWREQYCAALAAHSIGTDEYEVTVTLKVRGYDLEDVVARTFADPHCVAIRVQRAIGPNCRIGEIAPAHSGEIAF